MKQKWSLRALLLVLGAALPMYAQVAGRLTGTVVDPAGASVPKAKVRLSMLGSTTALLSTETTSDGIFDFTGVRPDYYTLTIEIAGFNKYVQNQVKVDPSRATTLPPIQLELAQAAQTVEVTAGLPAIDTSTAEVASTVTQAQVDRLPILDRQVNNLFYTQAGVSNSRTVTSINGLRPSYTNIMLDGVNVQDAVRTNAVDNIPNRLTIGQIAEMTLASSNVNPTIGGNATVISLSTPSGTNEFHGNGYWYNRNSFFAANDWFNNQSGTERPRLNLNQLGGSIGGPIKKDKLFFFTNYEAYRLKQQSLTTNTILTAPARQGVLTLANGSTFNLLQTRGVQIDPYIQNLLSKLPTASNTSNVGDQRNTTGYAFNAQDNETRDNVTGKLDYYLNTSHNFSATYSWNRDIADRPDLGSFYTTLPPIYNDSGANFFSAAWRWSVSPTFTNELRGGLNKIHIDFVTRDQLPSFFISGPIFTSPENTSLPETRTVDNYVLQDNASWVRGKHTMSFGFQANLFRYGFGVYSGIVPSYTIGTSTTNPDTFRAGDIPGATSTDITMANNLLASLAGMINAYTQTFNVTSRTSGYVPNSPQLRNLRMNNLAPYFTDTWKVARRLSLTLGLRWEYFTPVDEQNALMAQPLLINNNPITTLLGNATIDFGGSAAGHPLYKKDLNNFAPNVGLAWDVFGNGRTAFRAGYAITYANDNNLNTVYNALTQNGGLTTAASQVNVNARLSGLPGIATPPLQFPTTTQALFNLSPNNLVEGMIDPNLVSPYVQQWNAGIQQEYKGFVFEGRYVGNHVVKQFKQVDINQVNVRQGTYIQDFITARNNGFLALQATGRFNPTYNPAITGSKPTPFFDTLPSGGFLTNATVSNSIVTGELGSLAQTYQTNGILPDNFSFFPNPLLLYSSLLTNLAHTTYDALQVEVRKRTRNGVQFQANYTFSKSFSNAELVRGLEPQLDNASPSIEKARSPFDLTHAFKLNHYVPLPFGPGRKYNPGNGLMQRIIAGWGASGFLVIQSGPPVSIFSNRGTLNRGSRSNGLNTVDTPLTLSQLKNITGLYKTGDGVFFIDPKYIDRTTGRGAAPDTIAPFANQVFFNPQPGTLGSLQRRILDGPGFWNYDFSLQKDTRITERQTLQFRADFFNLFNHPNFYTGDSGTAPLPPDVRIGNINSSTFARITETMNTGNGVGARVMQFGLLYRF